MARFKVFLKPFQVDGTYAPEFIDITKDVVKLGGMAQSIEDSDFDVGVIRNNAVSLTINNSSGRYSPVGSLRTVFFHKIKNSIVRITWDARDYDLVCGFFRCGEEILGGQELAIEGVLNSVASESEIDNQTVTFKVLGYESILDGVEFPFADVENGDLFSEVLYKALNQSPLKDLVVIDEANINLGVDLAIDNKEDWENTTVGEILPELLLGANSILYIEKADIDSQPVLYAKARLPGDDLKFTFYGQASIRGIENIIDIRKIRDGINRTFNYWVWDDDEVRVVRKDDTSIEQLDILKKEMSVGVIDPTSTEKIGTILEANRDEFAFPKVELEVETPIWYTSLGLRILDRVNIDYPTIYVPADNKPLPRYGQARYGQFRYPIGQYSLTISDSRRFKILSKKIDPAKQSLIFGLREI